jgi:hypothetical protein
LPCSGLFIAAFGHALCEDFSPSVILTRFTKEGKRWPRRMREKAERKDYGTAASPLSKIDVQEQKTCVIEADTEWS